MLGASLKIPYPVRTMTLARTLSYALGLGLLGAGLTACLDLKPAAAPVVRWLQIAVEPARKAPDLEPPTMPALGAVRVSSSEAVTSQLARRRSAVELSYDDYARWVEPPGDAIERVIIDELFNGRGFVRDRSSMRSLDVEVVAFEATEVPRLEAVVTLLVHGVDGEHELGVFFDERIEGRIPLDGTDPAVVAEGLSAALRSAAQELSDLLAR